MSKLHKLKLHESKEIYKDCIAIRVPGGWLYSIYAPNGCSTTFVPYSDEFNERYHEQSEKEKNN